MATYQEFARQIKEKYPEYKDVDDLKLANAMIEKYPEYKDRVTFNEAEPQEPLKAGVSIDVTPSGLFKGSQNVVGSAIAAPIIAKRDNISVKDAFNKNMDKVREYRKNNPTPVQDFLVDVGAYSLIPQTNVLKGAGLASKLGNFAVNAGLQGGIPGLLEGLKQGNAGQGALTGTGIAGTIQGLANSIPYIGKANKVLGEYGKKIAGKISQLDPETIAQAVKPTSKALDYTKSTIKQKEGQIVEYIRNAYNQVLADKGNQVGRLLADLPEDKVFKAGDVLQDYDKIYNNYSLSKNPRLNPARNATKKQLEEIEDLVYGDTTKNLQNFKNDIDNLKYPNGKLDTTVNRYKNQYYAKTRDTLDNNITLANRRFNDEILGNLKENPEWITDPKKIEALENQISTYSVPEEYQQEMFNKLYEAIGKGDRLNINNNPVTPKELYDINKNISERMVNWDKVGGENDIRNSVLDQMYGMNAQKISDLSPALKDANKVYSDLMDFKKNEGIRAILNPNNTDNAISKLKNYDSMSSVQKGQNIRELENMLVNEGYAPFLSDIDDIVAAQNLLETNKTGLGGLTGLIKEAALRPALLGVRKYNQSNLPAILQNIGGVVGDVSRRIIPASLIAPWE